MRNYLKGAFITLGIRSFQAYGWQVLGLDLLIVVIGVHCLLMAFQEDCRYWNLRLINGLVL